MFTKVIVIASFILLSWNSFLLSKNNAFLRDQVTHLISTSNSLQELAQSNHDNFKKNSSRLNDLVKVSELSLLTDSIAQFNTRIKKQSDLIKESNTFNTKSNKTIHELIQSITSTMQKNKNNIAKYSNALASLNVCKVQPKQVSKNTYFTKKYPSKTQIKAPASTKKAHATVSETLLNQVRYELYKTKALHDKKALKEALTQLTQLKAIVWKSREQKNVSKDAVMSILSSIDITKNKWNNKQIDYPLDKVENKINKLFEKWGGVCK